MTDTVPVDVEAEPKVSQYLIWLCELCIGGAGGECHVPGCALFLHRAPDTPILEPMCQPYDESSERSRVRELEQEVAQLWVRVESDAREINRLHSRTDAAKEEK